MVRSPPIGTCGRYPSLRVAYIDEVEETSKDKSKKMVNKVYYSALAKVASPTKPSDSSEPVQSLDQVRISSIKWMEGVNISCWLYFLYESRGPCNLMMRK